MLKKIRGAYLLVMVMVIMLVINLLVAFAASYSITNLKISRNTVQIDQASQASEAGLEYGLAYLQTNSATIQGTAVAGLINYTLPTVTLSNGSTFSVNYSNFVALNYATITITSTGTSADAIAKDVIAQVVYQTRTRPVSTITSHGNVTLIGGATISTNTGTTNIMSGGSVSLNNGAKTKISGVTSSTSGAYGIDIIQNNSSISAMSEPSFFYALFGATAATVKAGADLTYTNSPSGGDYSSILNGVTGKTIYIDQTNGSTVSLGGGGSIGSTSDPVILVVNGNFRIDNGVRFYGYIYATGTISVAGGARIDGGFASYGATDISNGAQTSTTTDYTNLSVGVSSYTKVAGSWKDF
jgi:Tfp pilus assembly protein PilX